MLPKKLQKTKQKYTNEIIERSKSIFSQSGSGAHGFEEPPGKPMVTVRYRYIGKNKN